MKFEEMLLDKALKVKEFDIESAAYDFADALQERTAQICWEAMPGKSSGVLPGIFNAPLEQQIEYLHAIDKALRDENGHDIIAKMVGLAGSSTIFGFSGWEGYVGAGAQTKTFVATDSLSESGRRGPVMVSDEARRVINLYAAIRGMLLNQDAVAWHYPVHDKAITKCNGIELRFARNLSYDEAGALYRKIIEMTGLFEYAPIFTDNGVRFLNFTETPNRKFHEIIERAYNAVPGLPDVQDFAYFRSDGELIARNKEASSNGQDYQGIIAAAGRPDLQGGIEVLARKVRAVNEYFAEKYGWGNPGEAGQQGQRQATEEVASVSTARPYAERGPPIDMLPVGGKTESHPAIKYALPASMGFRHNIGLPDSVHREVINSAAHDIEAAGFPLRAAMQAVKGIATYNSSYADWYAAWIPGHRVVAFSKMRLIEMEGDRAFQRYLRGWLAHERRTR